MTGQPKIARRTLRDLRVLCVEGQGYNHRDGAATGGFEVQRRGAEVSQSSLRKAESQNLSARRRQSSSGLRFADWRDRAGSTYEFLSALCAISAASALHITAGTTAHSMGREIPPIFIWWRARNKGPRALHSGGMKISISMVLLAAAAVAPAQVVQKKTLTLAGAEKAIQAAIAQAHRNQAGGVIAVVDDGGNLMALERVDGTFAAGANISIGKARTAALFKKPTRAFEEIIGRGRTSMVALNDFTPLQGGVPIVIDGDVVGAVGVSGAASAQQDEELAMAAAAAVTNGPAAVTYFDHGQVSAAFDKGAVLYDQGQRYMVHASRREKAGMAEVHNEDADVIYVLDGTATFVTGGKAEGLQTVASGELRGSSITGGETRQLRKGDVVVVPAGTPHQFTEVSNPFLYYVVKAR